MCGYSLSGLTDSVNDSLKKTRFECRVSKEDGVWHELMACIYEGRMLGV